MWPWQAPIRVTGGTYEERKEVRQEVKRVEETPRGKELVKMIKDSGQARVINLKDHWNNANSDTPGKNVRIDPNFHPSVETTAGKVPASTARIIGHELGHAVTGAGKEELTRGAMDNVRQNENPIATHLNPPEPARIKY